MPGPDYVANNNFSQVLTGTQLTGTAKTHVHISKNQKNQELPSSSLKTGTGTGTTHIPGS